MIATIFLALLSIASAVLGQSSTPSTAGIPQCLVTCTQASCSLTDLQCICITNISAITACVLSSCDAADQATAATLAGQECGTLPNLVLSNFIFFSRRVFH